MHNFIHNDTLLNYLLTPLSGLYRSIVYFRRLLYQKNLFKVTRLPVPIIVIGNLTVGGTGKTPLVIGLANYLRSQGYQPGIVSRGYGGQTHSYPQLVMPTSNPQVIGDEPLLISRNTHCPVVVDPDRVAAVRYLLQNHDCNVVLSDDGLQHYALARDIEIVVIDGMRKFGNGMCLPAGPLRESQTRLATIDYVINNLTHLNEIPDKNAAGNYFQLVPKALRSVSNPQKILPFAMMKSQKVHAVAGIGNPQQFFKTLQQLHLALIEHPFPDHYLFKQSDIDFDQDKLVIMTEKDAVKCQAFADERHWYLEVSIKLSEEFPKQLLAHLQSLASSSCKGSLALKI